MKTEHETPEIQPKKHRIIYVLSLLTNVLFVRILEYELQNLGSGAKASACEVELWDCAGDFK